MVGGRCSVGGALLLALMFAFHGDTLVIGEGTEAEWDEVMALYSDLATNGLGEGATCKEDDLQL